MSKLSNVYLGYAVKNFSSMGITKENYAEVLNYSGDETYYQALYEYAINLQEFNSISGYRRENSSSREFKLVYDSFFGGGLKSNNTPGNNRAQNKPFNDAAYELNLNKAQRRKLHEEITGQGLSYREILERGREMFGKKF